MEQLTPLGIAWDAWRATHGGPEAIGRRQRARLADLVTFVRQHSRYYAQHYRGLPPGAVVLADLPPVEKPQLMADFDAWVTDPAVTLARVTAFVSDPRLIGTDYLGRYAVFTTSGSTGEPALLVQDQRALAVMNGLAYVRGVGLFSPGELWRVLRGGARQAAVFATGGHYLGAAMMERRLRARSWRRKIARLFSALTPLPELVSALNAFQPVLLGGYPSVLALLAEEQAAGRLQIRPALISVAGETLTASVRARIEEVFGCRLFETYSVSEAAPLALPCRRGRLHVNADWFILEPVDEQSRPVPPGQRSHAALVTNLANLVQPVIRYNLGDRIIMGSEPCPCGCPLPTVTVEGRTDDVLAFPTAAGGPVRILPLAIASVAEESPGVHRVQLVQTGPARLAVRLAVEPGTDERAVWAELAQRLRAFLEQHGARVVLERSAEPPSLAPRSGKFRQVWVAPDACSATSGVAGSSSGGVHRAGHGGPASPEHEA